MNRVILIDFWISVRGWRVLCLFCLLKYTCIISIIILANYNDVDQKDYAIRYDIIQAKSVHRPIYSNRILYSSVMASDLHV